MGSFGMGAGQDAIQQAIMARQEGGQVPPQLEQTMGNPNVPSPVGADPNTAVPQMSDPGVSAKQPPTTETELIIKALSQRLGAISKVEQAQIQPPAQDVPAFAPQGAGMTVKPQTQPPTGGGGYNIIYNRR